MIRFMKAPALGAGIAILLALATVVSGWPGSPLRAGAVERSDLPSVLFIAALALAFALYVAALVVLRRRTGGPAVVCAVAAAIQLVPLGGPLLLSRDVSSYWAYGRLAAVHDANPYAVAPRHFPADPAVRNVAPAWQGATSVYGPAFTAASAGLETAAGRSAESSSFAYRVVAAAGMLALVALAALLAPVPSFGAAFVGWNPLLAIDFAGGGHNDVWMMVFVLGALALAARRPALAGAGWALAAGVKIVAVGLLPLRLLAAGRDEAGRTALGFAAAVAVGACAASFFFGTAWLSALGPAAHRHAAWAFGSRLVLLGLPRWIALVPLALALPWLVRGARRGRPRMGAASALGLLATPWLLPWYAVWAVPLAAIEDDPLGWALGLGLSVYLLADRVPV
jgi:hypothetical protein